jgi:hypothetical protein
MPHDWRDSLRLAADLALVGILLTLLSLPLFTAGAAVATSSAAINHLIVEGRWPSFADCRAEFRRRLLPGLVAGPAAAATAALITIDVLALRRGAVPGGTPMVVVVLAIAVACAGWLALLAVRAGTAPKGAFRASLAVAAARPAVLPATAGVLAVAAVLAAFVHPVLIPVLAGFALFALHVVVSRVAPPPPPRPGPPAPHPDLDFTAWDISNFSTVTRHRL